VYTNYINTSSFNYIQTPINSSWIKLEGHPVERIYLRQRCFDASKPRLAAATGAQYLYVGFSRRNKIQRCSAYDIGESNPVPDRAQTLISSSMSRHQSTCKMSSKYMHAFLSNLANRQTDKQCGQSHLRPPLSKVNNGMT